MPDFWNGPPVRPPHAAALAAWVALIVLAAVAVAATR
jgi:hypothetical protein